MTKTEALALIDHHKNSLIDPVEMLRWTWLRVIILHTADEAWEEAVGKAIGVLTR